MFDFYRGIVEINYNRLPANSGNPVQDENGWAEDYFFPVTPGLNLTRTYMRNLVAARAALLPLGVYIFRANFHQASQYRSVYSLNGNAINPVIDSDESYALAVEPCNDIDSGPEFRFETGSGRRWQRVFRAMRDSWMNDMSFSPGNYSYDPVSAMAAPQAATSGGTQATATATVTAGSVSAVTITTGGGGYTIPPYISFVGGNNNGYATGVLTGGVVTGVTGLAGGTGYSVAPTVWIPPPQSEPWGLMPGQLRSTLIANFLSCVGNYCINFHSVRTTNSAFPSGFMTQGDTVPAGGSAGYVANRILFQGIGNHQTGQIRTTNQARKKRAI